MRAALWVALLSVVAFAVGMPTVGLSRVLLTRDFEALALAPVATCAAAIGVIVVGARRLPKEPPQARYRYPLWKVAGVLALAGGTTTVALGPHALAGLVQGPSSRPFVADAVREQGGRGTKAPLQVRVGYTGADGVRHEARLMGLEQGSYEAPLDVVVDPAHPDRAMTPDDLAYARKPAVRAGTVIGLGLLVVAPLVLLLWRQPLASDQR